MRLIAKGNYLSPETEAARAKICFGILKTCSGASNPTYQYLHWARRFGRHPLSDQVLQEFTEGIIKRWWIISATGSRIKNTSFT